MDGDDPMTIARDTSLRWVYDVLRTDGDGNGGDDPATLARVSDWFV